jgi:hypothetical protein
MPTSGETVCYTTNRRRASRIDVEPLIYLTKGTNAPGFILNLSEDGIAIQAMEVLRQGERIQFQFLLPKAQAEISGIADIVWCDSTGRAGLKFSSLGAFDRSQLHRWVTGVQSN